MNKLLMLMAACTFAAAPAFAADTAAAPAAPAAPNAQQEKMKACNTKAAGKTGDDRKQFMSTPQIAAPSSGATSC